MQLLKQSDVFRRNILSSLAFVCFFACMSSTRHPGLTIFNKTNAKCRAHPVSCCQGSKAHSPVCRSSRLLSQCSVFAESSLSGFHSPLLCLLNVYFLPREEGSAVTVVTSWIFHTLFPAQAPLSLSKSEVLLGSGVFQ